MASSAWKLKALLKKNYYEMKRNIFTTIIEVFFPIIVVFLLYIVKIIYSAINIDFDSEEGSIQNYTKKHSVYNSDSYPLLNISSNTTYIKRGPYFIPEEPIITPEIYGMSIHSAFNICSVIHTGNKIRPLIATIGVPYEIKNIMINESLYFSNLT